MKREDIINNTEQFAISNMEGHDGGHDWWHLHRVRQLSLYIQKSERTGDPLVVEIAALLHDTGDSKFRTGPESVHEDRIRQFLETSGLERSAIEKIVNINRNISFSKGVSAGTVTDEFRIVQDADRLDAIGAIGIARAFNYGGFRNRPVWDPENTSDTTVQHFYDKLLRLKDMMNTNTGSKLAINRHNYLEEFLKRFFEEWQGEK